MSCVVNLSINIVSPSLAVFGVRSTDIVMVDLQRDKYLQHSVIQFLVIIVGSYLAKSASKSAWLCRIPAECIPISSGTGHPWYPEFAGFQSITVVVHIIVPQLGDTDLSRHTYMFQKLHYLLCFCLLQFLEGSH
jgi:hypothetical protein